MTQKQLWFSLLSLLYFIGFSQDMKEGFNYLETGKYQEASLFFEKILTTYPSNKTAKLCYGRAVGLNGNALRAISIFEELKKEYPNDYEIKLNYAESLLWNKEFKKAEGFYKQLVNEDKSSFPAVLGYANTLSNLKKYEEALLRVNEALLIIPANPNALISRKYIRLGYASKLAQKREYDLADQMLDKNLKDFPRDKDTLLNKINIYMAINKFEEAKSLYKQLGVKKSDSILSLNGLALIAHKMHKEKKALKIAEGALIAVKPYEKDSLLTLNVKERYIQALIWNGKYVKAREEINELYKKYPNHSKVLAMESGLGMYTSNFDKSIENYQKILANDSTSFDGNLGIANAYRAVNDPYASLTYAYKTLRFYPEQRDAQKLIKTLNLQYSPFVEHKTSYTIDNGDNEAWSFLLKTEIPFSTKLTFTGKYIYRTTRNKKPENDHKATSNNFTLGGNYKLTKNISIVGELGVLKANSSTNDYSQLLTSIFIKAKPFKLQNLEIGYSKELQDFNAELVDRKIVMNNYIINYNLNTNFNLGWYTQYIYTTQSDENKRNLLFTSLYYKILRRPSTKIGFNYQYISFDNQVPEIYFSPSRFNVVEIFADLIKNSSEKEAYWFYRANAAAGYQFIENEEKSTTFRIEGELGYQFSDRLRASLYGKHSNIASATAAGFKFTEVGFKLKWYLTSKPLFYKKIEKIETKILKK